VSLGGRSHPQRVKQVADRCCRRPSPPVRGPGQVFQQSMNNFRAWLCSSPSASSTSLLGALYESYIHPITIFSGGWPGRPGSGRQAGHRLSVSQRAEILLVRRGRGHAESGSSRTERVSRSNFAAWEAPLRRSTASRRTAAIYGRLRSSASGPIWDDGRWRALLGFGGRVALRGLREGAGGEARRPLGLAVVRGACVSQMSFKAVS